MTLACRRAPPSIVHLHAHPIPTRLACGFLFGLSKWPCPHGPPTWPCSHGPPTWPTHHFHHIAWLHGSPPCSPPPGPPALVYLLVSPLSFLRQASPFSSFHLSPRLALAQGARPPALPVFAATLCTASCVFLRPQSYQPFPSGLLAYNPSIQFQLGLTALPHLPTHPFFHPLPYSLLLPLRCAGPWLGCAAATLQAVGSACKQPPAGEAAQNGGQEAARAATNGQCSWAEAALECTEGTQGRETTDVQTKGFLPTT
jgi:hypothetical protein